MTDPNIAEGSVTRLKDGDLCPKCGAVLEAGIAAGLLVCISGCRAEFRFDGSEVTDPPTPERDIEEELRVIQSHRPWREGEVCPICERPLGLYDELAGGWPPTFGKMMVSACGHLLILKAHPPYLEPRAPTASEILSIPENERAFLVRAGRARRIFA